MLAVLFSIDKALGAGTMLITFLATTTIYFISLWKDEKQKKSLSLLFIVVFFLYILASLFFYYTKFQPFSGGYGDYVVYNEQAQAVSQAIHNGNLILKGVTFYNLYPAFVGYLYAFIFPSSLVGRFFNCWLVALTVVFLYLLVREMGGNEKQSFGSGLLAALYPSLGFFGTMLIKDPFVITLSMLGLLLSFKIIKGFSVKYFVGFYIVLIALVYLRFYIGYALVLAFFLSWLVLANMKIKKRIVYAAIMVFLFGFLPILGNNADVPGGGGYMGMNAFQTFMNPNAITFYKEVAYPVVEHEGVQVVDPKYSKYSQAEQERFSLAEGYKNSSFMLKTGLENPLTFIENTSLSYVFAFLGPFPWQINSLRQALALPEVFIWYVLLFFIIKGIIIFVRRKNFTFLPLVIFSFMAFGVLAVFLNNYGILARIRIPAFLALLCIFPFGFEKLNNIRVPFFIKKIVGPGQIRSFLNDEEYPHLEERFLPEGGKVLDVGKPEWDYRKFFKKSRYIVSDVDENLKPDVVDDITKSKFADEEFDMVIFNGVYEQIKEERMAKAFSQIKRILKKGGILILGVPGVAMPVYPSIKDTGRRIENKEDVLNLITNDYEIFKTQEFFENDKLSYVYWECKKL